MVLDRLSRPIDTEVFIDEDHQDGAAGLLVSGPAASWTSVSDQPHRTARPVPAERSRSIPPVASSHSFRLNECYRIGQASAINRTGWNRRAPGHRGGRAGATRSSVWSPTLAAWTSRRPIGHATRSGVARTERRRAESISAIHNAFGVINSFLPNDSARFSDLVPDATRPGPSAIESVWTAGHFTFQRLHPSCRVRPGTTSSLSDRLEGSEPASAFSEERAGLGLAPPHRPSNPHLVPPVSPPRDDRSGVDPYRWHRSTRSPHALTRMPPELSIDPASRRPSCQRHGSTPAFPCGGGDIRPATWFPRSPAKLSAEPDSYRTREPRTCKSA